MRFVPFLLTLFFGVSIFVTACAKPKFMNKPLEFGTSAGIPLQQIIQERMPNEQEKAKCSKSLHSSFKVVGWQRVTSGRLHGIGGVHGETGYTSWGSEFEPIDEKDVRLFKSAIKGTNLFGVEGTHPSICFYKYKDGQYTFIQRCGMKSDKHVGFGSLKNCPLGIYKRKKVPWKPINERKLL